MKWLHRILAGLRAAEPVRTYLYSVGAAVVALLVGYGVMEATYAPLWLAAGVAVLGVPAVERARAAVDSPATRARKAGQPLP